MKINNRILSLLITLILGFSISISAQVDLSTNYCDYLSIESFKIISTDKGDIAEVVLINNGPDLLSDSEFILSLDQPGPVVGSPTFVTVDQWPGLGGTIVTTFSVEYIGIGVPDDMDVEGIESAGGEDNTEDGGIGIGVPDDMDVTGIIKVINPLLGLECHLDITFNTDNIISPCLRMSTEDADVILGQDTEINIPFKNSSIWNANYVELILDRNSYLQVDPYTLEVSKIIENDSHDSFLISTEYDVVDGAIYNDESISYEFTLYSDASKMLGCTCAGNLNLRRNETGGIINADELLVGARLYPNPVNDKLNIRLENNVKHNVSLLITDLSGRTYESSFITDNFATIDVSDYPLGVYTVNIVSNNQVKTDKIIIR